MSRRTDFPSRIMHILLPQSPFWTWRRGIWHLRRVLHSLSANQAKEAALALTLLERAHGRLEDKWQSQGVTNALPVLITRAGHLNWISHAALEAGQSERAAELAEAVLALEREMRVQAVPIQVHDGSFQRHAANIILGRVALQEGRPERAEVYLLTAVEGDHRGPVLETYGPDFTLANLLLEIGHRDSVYRYLESCRELWVLGRDLIDSWLQEMKQGRTPQLDKAPWMRTRGLADVVRAHVRRE
jgi:tetratricopeptide (TPR) repeat protein